VEIIGPKAVSLRGGMGGTYVKTTGEAGEAKLIVQAEGLEPVAIQFTIA
jgi:beta-galactosidase